MLLLPFNSLLARSYTEGFVISPGVDVAERSEVSPIGEILTACWSLCPPRCRSSVFAGLLKIIRNGPVSTLAIALNTPWQELSDLLTETCLAGGG